MATRPIYVVAPDGQVGTIPDASVDEALALGYRLEGDDERRARELGTGVVNETLAGAAGAARSLSLGLSDQVLTKTGLVAPETLHALKTANPNATLAGEVIGGGVGVLAPGGLIGAASKGVKAIAGLGATAEAAAAARLGMGTNIAGRALRTAASKGAGSAVEGVFYGAGQLLSEEALGETNITAQKIISHIGMGALLGGAMGGALGMTSTGLSAARHSLKETMANRPTVTQWLDDFAGERVLKAAFGQQKRAFVQLERRKLQEQAQDYLLNKLGVAPWDSNAEISTKLAKRSAELEHQLGNVVADLDRLAQRPIILPQLVADRVEAEVADAFKDIAASRSIYNAVKNEAEAIRKLGDDPITFESARVQRRAMQDQVNYQVDGKPLAEAKKAIARVWNDVIDESATPYLHRVKFLKDQSYRELRHEFALIEMMNDYAQDRARSNAANRFISPSDYGVGLTAALGSALTGNVGALAVGTGAAVAHKIMRERGTTALAFSAKKLAALRGLERASSQVSKKIESSLDAFLHSAKRAAVIASVKASDKHTENFDGDELATLATHPQALVDRLAIATADIQEAAPQLASALALKTTQAVNFLHERAPKSPVTTASLNPLAKKWKPSAVEIARWRRYRRAVDDPLSVLEDLARGEISLEASETLRTLYPELHDDIVRQITERAAELKEELPYIKRVTLSLLLGVPLDESMRPDYVTRIQTNYQQAIAPSLQAPTSAKLSLAAASATPTEELLSK